MNVFRKRPLSLILCIMLGGFSLFIDADIVASLTVVGLSALVFVLSFVFKDLLRGREVIARFACLGLAVSVLLAVIFSATLNNKDLLGKRVSITGEVKDVKPTASYATALTVQTDTINDTPYSLKLLVTIEPSEHGGAFVGDKVSLSGIYAGFESGDDSFDARSYYIARGYQGRITNVEEFLITDGNTVAEPDLFAVIQSNITSTLMLSTDKHTGGFLAALIMGDKDYLDPNTNLNYALIGISHILALSGMHLVILSEAIRYLLSRLKINKKIILLISTLFCLLYMAVTGFPASVVRSAVMLTITNGMFLLTGVHDSYTTLPLSVVIILIFQPHAVFDISLWLSAFATLGVLVFAEIDKKHEKKERGIIASLLFAAWQSIFATILAVGASYILMLWLFDTTSLIAPITTLIFSVPINFLIFAGIGILILHPIIPSIGLPVIWLTDTINEVVEVMASWQWAIISLDFVAVQVIVVIFAIFFYSILILKIDRFKTAVAISVCLFLSSSVVGVILTQSVRYSDSLMLSPNSYTDMMILKDGGNVTVIAPGTHNDYAAYENADTIINERITCVDNIVLTGYTFSTVEYLGTLLGEIKADVLYVPEPHSTEELGIAEGIADTLMTYGTDLFFYEEKLGLSFGEYTYRMVDRNVYRGEYSDCIFTLSRGEKSYTYLSCGATEKLAATSKILAYSSERIIFGSHGSGYSSSHAFSIVSDSVCEIYSFADLPLSDTSEAYYKEKGVPITRISTPYELYVE